MAQTPKESQMKLANQEQFRQLPSVDNLLKADEAIELIGQFGRTLTVEAMRSTLEECRKAVSATGSGY